MFGYDPAIITFTIYILGMLLIGILAYRYTSNLSDYILGGRSLSLTLSPACQLAHPICPAGY